MLSNFLSFDHPNQLLAQPNTLAVLGIGAGASPANEEIISTRLELISDDTKMHEVWTVEDEKVESGKSEYCAWRRSKSWQFSAVTLPLAGDDDYREIAYQAYRNLLQFISSSSHPELIRFWNYIPFINKGAGLY